jgi:DNA-binding MarR family transcriptional regulator
VALTPVGRRTFEKVARAHEGWVIELLGGLDADGKHQLLDLLGRLRQHLSRPGTDEETPP